LERCDVDFCTAQLVVRRLTNGKQLRREPATVAPLQPQSIQSVTWIVVKADGAVAWIGYANATLAADASITETEVHAYDEQGHRMLDSGLAIGLHSLRLHGSKLTWTDGGTTRTATLH
jgi:hypothetical protein